MDKDLFPLFEGQFLKEVGETGLVVDCDLVHEDDDDCSDEVVRVGL